MKVTDEMVEAALKAHYSAWGTAKKSQDMYRDAMRAALEAVIPLSDPAAWQWLDTANFRKAIPESSNPSEWNPLYRHPALSHAVGQDGEQCRAASGEIPGLDRLISDCKSINDRVFNLRYDRQTGERLALYARLLSFVIDNEAALRALSRGVPEGETVPKILMRAVKAANSAGAESLADDILSLMDTHWPTSDTAIAAQRKEGE